VKKPVRARTKVTKNGRIMGRPSGDPAPGQMMVERPVVTRRLVGLAPPRAVPLDGTFVPAYGPPRPIYEERENGVGRWGQTTGDDTLWIIRAIEGRGRNGYAAKVAEQLAEEKGRLVPDVKAVKRKLLNTRAAIKAVKRRLDNPRKVPPRISDIPQES
jgi:hypothetical protein